MLESYLRSEGVPFHTQRHSVAYTARGVAAAEHLPYNLVAKVVVVFADAKPVMLVLPAAYHVDLVGAGAAIGAAAVRLAHEDELRVLFDNCVVGTMPPFGNLYDLPVYVDESLTRDERIVFQVGTHADTMRLAYRDYAHLVRPIVADFAAATAEFTATR
jgi:Ala-tRNA(Pro) deacylase